MNIITKTCEIIFQPAADNHLLIRKIDLVVDEKLNVIGTGNEGEYVETFVLPLEYIENILAFVGKLFGRAIAADREILCVNWQFVDDKIFASVATAQPFYDAEKTRIGQSMPHRQSVELTAKQQKSVMTFIADGFGKPVDDELVNDEINV
jgi:hypothetical protein